MGGLGTPIIAVEGGIVEAMGWNRYGGWRIGIRSFDSKRYYYYAHLQKDTPFAKDMYEGKIVQPGDVIGFMGRTGYSDKENTNNIETVHLHFGLQLVFGESQKECNSETWIDVYNIVRLLSNHRSTVKKIDGSYTRIYPFVDLDTQMLLEGQ
jgi:murein DD-endopeptidase MepM/ murein hydrolase activator NlpD